MPLSMRLHWSPILCAALSLAACRSAPAPPPAPGPLALPPGLELSTWHHYGTILSGPREGAQAFDAEAAHAYVLNLRLLSLERLPGEGVAPLSARTRIVASPDHEQPVRGATRLASGAGYCEDERAAELWRAWLEGAAGRSTLAGEATCALPAGLTFTIDLRATETIEDPGNFLGEWPARDPVQKRLAIAVERGAGEASQRLTIGLGFTDLAPGLEGAEPSATPPVEGGRPDGDFLQQEWVVPDLLPRLDGGPLVLALPSPFASGEGEAYAVWIELTSALSEEAATAPVASDQQEPAPGESPAESEESEELSAHAASVQLALLEANTRAAALGARGPALTDQALAARGLARAYSALRDASSERELRAPLLHLGEATQAPLTRDLALVSDEAGLRAWVERLAEPPPGTQPNELWLEWQLERAAWLQLSARALNESLPFELDSLLLRHAGEVGRYPSTIEDAARRSATRADFQARLVGENLLFLEDSNISARVRAFDWLRRSGAAPENFDPLGTSAERKAALAGPPTPEGAPAGGQDSPR